MTALKLWVQLHREGEAGPSGRPDDPVNPAKYKALEARLREVTRGNNFLNKSRRVYRHRRTVEDLYWLVQEKNADFPVTWMCARLGIPRVSYYRWLEHRESTMAARHRELTGQVKTTFDSSDGIFGHRMINTKLAAAGVEVSWHGGRDYRRKRLGGQADARVQTHYHPLGLRCNTNVRHGHQRSLPLRFRLSTSVSTSWFRQRAGESLLAEL